MGAVPSLPFFPDLMLKPIEIKTIDQYCIVLNYSKPDIWLSKNKTTTVMQQSIVVSDAQVSIFY